MRLFPHHKVFLISQEMAKVNVKEISGLSYHDIVIVTVANTLYII